MSTMLDSASLDLPLVLGVVGGGLSLWMLYSALTSQKVTSKSGARIPKGSDGWPLIGQSKAYVEDPENFVKAYAKRYGNVFKTSLFFRDVIIGTTADFAKFVYTNTEVFQEEYPHTIKYIVGPRGFQFLKEPKHLNFKKVVQRPIFPESLRNEIADLSDTILGSILSWADKGFVYGSEETKTLTWNVGFNYIFGLKNSSETPDGKMMLEMYTFMSKALLSVPLNFPGCDFRKGLKARERMVDYVRSLLEKRKKMKDVAQRDMLGALVVAQRDPKVTEDLDLDDDAIVDTLVAMVFASYDTLSATMVWILKLLHDHPEVMRTLQAEQEQILRSKNVKLEDWTLTWEDTRKMEYGMQFIQEVHRWVSLTTATFRNTTRTVEYQGHLIPKDTLVFVALAAIHDDPDLYPNPAAFNPSRFKTPVKPFTFLPFSSGAHMCAGYEFAKTIGIVFMHHLVTKFRWESTQPDTGTVGPVARTPKGGFPINIKKKEW